VRKLGPELASLLDFPSRLVHIVQLRGAVAGLPLENLLVSNFVGIRLFLGEGSERERGAGMAPRFQVTPEFRIRGARDKQNRERRGRALASLDCVGKKLGSHIAVGQSS